MAYLQYTLKRTKERGCRLMMVILYNTISDVCITVDEIGWMAAIIVFNGDSYCTHLAARVDVGQTVPNVANTEVELGLARV